MSRKQKAFSMAELLIALLAVSVIVSATIPTFTRKASTNEQVFRFVDDNTGSGYGGSGNSSSIIVGGNRSIDETNNYTNDGYVAGDQINVNNIDFDKMQLILSYEGGRNDEEASGDPTRSHLSFYNKNSDKTADNLHRVGRIYFDETNLGIGLHTLRYLVAGPGPNRANDFGRRNTAFGQLALLSFNNTGANGTDNTGVGYDALSADTDKTYVDLTPTDVFSNNFGINPTSGNTGIGSFALTYNGEHSYNTAVGRGAIYNPGEGQNTNANTAVGFNAMVGVDIANNNLIHAILAGTTDEHTVFGAGSANTALGAFSLSHANVATSNVAVGALALHHFQGTNAKVDNFGNVAVGNEALGNMTNGFGNTAIGHRAGRSLTSTNIHDNNVIIGHDTGLRLTATNDTTIIGAGSAWANYTDSDGKSVSNPLSATAEALTCLGSGLDCQAQYYESGKTAKYGRTKANDHSLVIGANGHKLIEGLIPDGTNTGALSINAGSYGVHIADNGNVSMQNLYVGAKSPTDGSTTDDNWLDNGTNEYGEIHVGNRVTIGYSTNTTNVPIEIAAVGTTANKQYIRIGGEKNYKGEWVNAKFYVDGDGNLTIAGNLTVTGNISGNGSNLTDLNADNIKSGTLDNRRLSNEIPHNKIERHYHYEYSDARLKNILSDSTAGLKEINALEIKNFTFKKDEKKTPHVGVIAQQLQKIFPNAVTKDDEGYLMIRTEDIFYAMVNSIKELYKNIQELTAKVTGLDKKITKLEKQNKELIEQNKAFEERLKKLESKVE